VKTFTATPEEFATGAAARRAVAVTRPVRKPTPKLPPRQPLEKQVGTITPEQFVRGDAYWTGKRREGHRTQPTSAIKPLPEMNRAHHIVDRLIEADELGAWWKPDVAPDDFEAREARRQEQSRLQTSMNKVSKFEPQSRALLDLVLGRDDMLKERNARHRLEAELSKHGLATDDVDDFIFKTRGSRDNMLNHLHVGPEADDAGKALTPRCGACPHDFSQVQPGDLIGIKTKDGKPHYFSGPLGGLPTHIANPTAR